MAYTFKELCEMYDEEHYVKDWKRVSVGYEFFCRMDEKNFYCHWRDNKGKVELLIVKTKNSITDEIENYWYFDTDIPSDNFKQLRKKLEKVLKEKIKEIECAENV